MKTLFNDGWNFFELPIPQDKMYIDGKKNLLTPKDFFNHSKNLSYSPVSFPHDWMIYDTKDLYRNSVGFYKKTFSLTKDDIQNRNLFLRFEGVYMNSGIWINDSFAGGRKYGYSTFEIDLTPFIKEGKNEILVICVYQNCNTRWYSGAGIFRDVHFINKPKTFIPEDGLYFVSKLKDEKTNTWSLKINCQVNGDSKGYKIQTVLTKLDGTVFFTTPKSEAFENTYTIENPLIWDIEKPDYYIAATNLYDKTDALVDSVSFNYGFKTVRFDKNEGLYLNGRNIVIYGACHHHDHGALGAAFNKNALRRQFLKLKEMGVNSVRCSHNPPPQAWMDLADELGLLIDDELFDMWEMPKTPFDYGNYFNECYKEDVKNWIQKDRNHPSLLMWSIGNEIFDTVGGNGLEITKKLYKEVMKYDPDKVAPITMASNYMMADSAQECAKELDLVGYNYLERLYDEHHKKYPEWIMYGSETASTLQSRGIYHLPESLKLLTFSDGQCSALENCTTPWGAKDTQTVITSVKHKKFNFGQYIWTGWDYIGEPTPYHSKNSFFGQIDTAGFPKDSFYMYKSEWNRKAKPFVHLLPYWDWNEGERIDVKAYTNAASVELFVNGKSWGLQTIDHENSSSPFASWNVEYHKGEIKAVAYDKDKNIIAQDIKKTPEDPSTVVLTPESYDTDNLFFIDIMVQDKNGVPVENARNYISVYVKDDAVLLGLDNGDSTDYEQYVGKKESHTRRLFSNRLVAIIQAKSKDSKFEVHAVSKELKGAALIYDGKTWSQKEADKAFKPQNDFIPSRKIEIISSEDTKLNKNHKSIKVTAKLYPLNASSKEINWTPVLPECVSSDFIKATDISGKNTGTETAVICAQNDGDCILRCTAKNNTPYDEVLSDLAFSVKDFGNSNQDPFTLIEACRFSDWDHNKNKPVICLESGISTRNNGPTWISFEKLDFGTQGADSIHVPIFSFMTELPLEIYDGTPDKNLCLGSFTYRHESIYNTYSENIFTLSKRLFGVHTISFVFKHDIYFKGFYFDKTPKALSKIHAVDASSITGDSFTKTQDEITQIGNNVSLVFKDMDFPCDDKKITKLTVMARANDHKNSLNLKILDSDGTSKTTVLEFEESSDYVEKTFELEHIQGQKEISFIFLPGSNFDFKWFKFE